MAVMSGVRGRWRANAQIEIDPSCKSDLPLSGQEDLRKLAVRVRIGPWAARPRVWLWRISMPTHAVALASASLVFPDYALFVVTVLPLLSLLISCLKLGCSVSPEENHTCTWSITCGVCQCLVPAADAEAFFDFYTR